MADDKRPRAALKAALLDLLANDDDVKHAIAAAVDHGTRQPALDEQQIVTLIEARVKSDSLTDAMTKESTTALVLDLFRAYLRPDAVNGSHATRLFART